jgi:hypothetical protein
MKTKKTFYKNKRTTVRKMLAWALEKPKREWPTSRLDKEGQRAVCFKPSRRWAVGYVRAFVGPHFFAGCYVGAEYE